MQVSQDLPSVLSGPILRRLEPGRLVLWLAGSAPLDLTLVLAPPGGAERRLALDDNSCRVVRVGRAAWIHLIDVALPEPLPQDTLIEYDLLVEGEGGIGHWAPHLLHQGETRPNLVLRSRMDDILYGSCRKPHHPSRDGLARGDALLADGAALRDTRARPAMLMLCGDQIYADDVAGPMLAAIHALIRRLGLYGEILEGATVEDSEALYAHPKCYYRREDLLPGFKSNDNLRDRFFGGTEKPVFTTANAHNHLVTLGEILAMYLLTHSPTPWQLVAEAPAPDCAQNERSAERWQREHAIIDDFRAELPQSARLLAHVQTLMIFDDHDVTDDWNLSGKWEATAYGHPFSRRIVGNALTAYLLCQGWGNRPEVFGEVLDEMNALFAAPDHKDRLDPGRQDALVDRLLAFNCWDYTLETEPAVIVLDTRTRRWRNRRVPGHPSGLMDWESLTELQVNLIGREAAVIVSAAPMFGVKLIEVVQRIATYAGLALTVDAENWMAHRGAASAMLNIFRHSRTPGNYVVLSGDVHYSFVYDVEVRFSDRVPHIWQITSSGVKNEFPARLLDWLDRLNRWLYSPRSPLNWFTKRRALALSPRLPDQRRSGERLWNGSGLGQVWLDAQGRPERIVQHNADGRPSTRFLKQGQQPDRRQDQPQQQIQPQTQPQTQAQPQPQDHAAHREQGGAEATTLERSR